MQNWDQARTNDTDELSENSILIFCNSNFKNTIMV